MSTVNVPEAWLIQHQRGSYAHTGHVAEHPLGAVSSRFDGTFGKRNEPVLGLSKHTRLASNVSSFKVLQAARDGNWIAKAVLSIYGLFCRFVEMYNRFTK